MEASEGFPLPGTHHCTCTACKTAGEASPRMSWRRVGYRGFNPPTPPSPALGFASLAYCWRRWRWLKSYVSAVLLPQAHASPHSCPGMDPLGIDLHPGAPRAFPCKPGWGHLLLDTFMGYAGRSPGCGSGRAPWESAWSSSVTAHSCLSVSVFSLS